jgi:DNA-binding response OmpR family regulator
MAAVDEVGSCEIDAGSRIMAAGGMSLARILIVDDEQKIRLMIRKYAEFEGYDVTEAADGMAAVRICRERDFDAIVMDIMMPELDGFSACREIFKTRQIPVLMLSARGEEYDKIHGFELGIDDYVVKPFSPKELMMRINVLISRNKRTGQQPARGFYRPDGVCRRCENRSFAKGIRFAVFSGAQPQHCPEPGAAAVRSLGL